jgi:hypothetical protein
MPFVSIASIRREMLRHLNRGLFLRRKRQYSLPYHAGIKLSEADIQTQFDDASLWRGDEYERQNRVSSLPVNYDIDVPTLTASVKGSGQQCYHVSVDLMPHEGELFCEGFCSCPVEVDCKHVVAALLHAVRQGEFGSPQNPSSRPVSAPRKPANLLGGAVGEWLDRVSAAADPTMAGTGQLVVRGRTADRWHIVWPHGGWPHRGAAVRAGAPPGRGAG